MSPQKKKKKHLGGNHDEQRLCAAGEIDDERGGENPPCAPVSSVPKRRTGAASSAIGKPGQSLVIVSQNSHQPRPPVLRALAPDQAPRYRPEESLRPIRGYPSCVQRLVNPPRLVSAECATPPRHGDLLVVGVGAGGGWQGISGV